LKFSDGLHGSILNPKYIIYENAVSVSNGKRQRYEEFRD